MSPNFSITRRRIPEIAGALLIALSCLVLGRVVWEQQRTIERADAIIAEVAQGPGDEQGLAVAVESRTRNLQHSLLAPLLLLCILAGSALLAREKIAHALEGGSDGINPRTPGVTSQTSGMIPAELLRLQGSLTRTERSAVATEFAASMSHDIRNPLAGIQMSLSNLIHESKDPTMRASLDALLSETHRVTDLLTRAVAAARLETGQSEDLDLSRLVEGLLALIRVEAPPGITLECEIEPTLQGRLSSDRLGHCLFNLITNSIRAIGENEGWVRLEISTRAEFLSFVITNNGPKFPQETLSGAPPPLNPESAGEIELAMARRFVREMGGRIEFSNTPPGGPESGARVAMLLPSIDHHG